MAFITVAANAAIGFFTQTNITLAVEAGCTLRVVYTLSQATDGVFADVVARAGTSDASHRAARRCTVALLRRRQRGSCAGGLCADGSGGLTVRQTAVVCTAITLTWVIAGAILNGPSTTTGTI